MATRKTPEPTAQAVKAEPAGNCPEAQYHPRVVVKFRDFIKLPYDRSAAEHLDRCGIGPWGKLTAEFKGISLGPLFASKRADEIQKLVERGRATDPTYRPPDLLAYFAVDIPPGVEAEVVAKALAAWPLVQIAYVEPPPVEPPVVDASDDPRRVNQGYLRAAPDGIDAEYAWLYAGGDGANQTLVDLEWGWTFNHEDLAAHGITLISGLNNSYFYHGTGVLGEVAAVDNALGCIGIAPAVASVRCVGQWLTGGGYSTSQPIMDAIATMNFGDVLLLEAQTSIFGYSQVPVELEPAVFEAIRLATALGIVVVEAGGNGGVDLDTVVNGAGRQVLNRASADFLDSGAIVVGAASSTAPHARLGLSCHGSRIDCFGWGENVDTLSSDATNTATNLYSSTFSGTSSASPIVTGACLLVQGLAEANIGHRFGPWQLREILSDPANGTVSANPATDRIGIMPNLRAIIDGGVFNLAPDVYVRDYVGDAGDPHTSGISASPDVILRQSAVANPQASFGEGSGTENSATQGYEAKAGQDNYIYVRVRNRGGTAATNVQATVYWSPVSSLVTPDLWTLVGTTTIAGVPTGDVLTVSNAIVWPGASIPATGHYCFVVLIGHALDPAPALADLLNWDNFSEFIRANNNVTWRNFNVVENVPPPSAEPPDYVAMPFMAAGAPDKARHMQLEIVARLPKGTRVLLEMPREFSQLLKVSSFGNESGRHKRVIRVPVNPHGRSRFAGAAFPARMRAPMRLLVNIPKELRQYEYEVWARQICDEQEVGRVTWRIGPPRKRK